VKKLWFKRKRYGWGEKAQVCFRKAGARRREAWSENFSAEKYL
jgi:hypothetical protein